MSDLQTEFSGRKLLETEERLSSRKDCNILRLWLQRSYYGCKKPYPCFHVGLFLLYSGNCPVDGLT